MERAAERRCRPSHGRFLPIHSRIPFRGRVGIPLLCALLFLAWGGTARADQAEPAQPPAAAQEAPSANGQTPPAATKEESPAEEGQKPADGEPAPAVSPPEPKSERQLGPPLAITGLGALEILARDYEESVRYYIEFLGFREEDASGGVGERRCMLVSGPVRITVREQPGKVIRPKRPPWLGIYPTLLSEVTAEAAGLKKAKGVLVDDLVPQGPAGIAGILKGDIILAIEGKEVASPEELTATIRSFPAGKKALVTLWREGKKRDLAVELPTSPFPEQLGPFAIRLQVRDLDAYYREALRRNLRLYAEPREIPGGTRILELVDPNDLLIVLEESRSEGTAPSPSAAPATPERDAQQQAPGATDA
ncbi:MAG TPA: PDZ domain-containing protein [Armatimonadota bacterium]|nr:PDZ domain-containing protein [Armatimonadota bacterium]HOJ20544.1 PDZ domain-containing protein [Armatimonadota bacterium]HOM80886.1 PDZ domain-containing protein [Armatimonadota bacterium]HPO72330.1 PDZ domain-containing protein [Armatimonadota bacterium]